jgi:serine/threonine-protein kinase
METEGMMTEKSPDFCPTCKTSIPVDSAPGVCPRCALHLASFLKDKQGIAGVTEDFSNEGIPIDEDSDRTLGRYSEVSVQGKGSMGRVLLVHDEVLDRNIVLKELLPPREATTASAASYERQVQILRSRFLREARITGRLEHPAIAPVYEMGTRKDGTLYYTMKRVRGATLSEAIDQTNGLTDRLALLPHFIDLCNALAYAHEEKVIHRDVKPSNVMVGDYGETILLDWGLAKDVLNDDPDSDHFGADLSDALSGLAMDETGLGEVLGSALYMSPEQARGEHTDIDYRTDVYSLGTILYQILTGQTPFKWTSFEEVIQQVLNDEPPSILSLCQVAPPELVAICERAMNKLADDRYQSASELAEEVQRFQSGALVNAYHYQPTDLVSRFVSRHKTFIGSATVTLIGVLVISLAFAVNAHRSAQRLAEAHDSEVAARLDVEAQRDLVMEAMDKLTYDVPKGLKDVPEARPIVQEMLDENVIMLNRILELSPDTTEARLKKISNYQGIGARWAVLGDTVSAVNAHLRAIEEAEALVLEYPTDPEANKSLALSYMDLAFVYRVQGDHAKALKESERALQRYSSLILPGQNDSALLLSMVRCWSSVGTCHFGLGDYLKALDCYAEAEEILKRLMADKRSNVEQQTESINLARDRGNAHWRRGEYIAAKEAFETGIGTIDALLANTPHDRELLRLRAYCLSKLGVTHRTMEQYDHARKWHFEANDILESLLDKDPLDVRLQRTIVSNQCDIGTAYTSEGAYDEAYPYFDRARKILEKLTSKDTSNTGLRKALGWVWNNLGDVDQGRGNYTGALEKYEKSRDMHEMLQKNAPANGHVRLSLAHINDNIGLLHFEYEKYGEAIAAFEQSRRAWNILRTEDPENVESKGQLAESLYALGRAYYEQKNPRAAVECLAESVVLFADIIVNAERRGSTLTYYGETVTLLRTFYDDDSLIELRRELQKSYVDVLRIVSEGNPNHIPYQNALASESAKLSIDIAIEN